eukprot:COSAG01_NODE_38285_length_491_cov_2.301020_2_plen_128_part_01
MHTCNAGHAAPQARQQQQQQQQSLGLSNTPRPRPDPQRAHWPGRHADTGMATRQWRAGPTRCGLCHQVTLRREPVCASGGELIALVMAEEAPVVRARLLLRRALQLPPPAPHVIGGERWLHDRVAHLA